MISPNTWGVWMLIFVACADMTASVSCKRLYSDCLKNEQHKTQVWELLLERSAVLAVQRWRILLWHSDLSWRCQLYWWQSDSSSRSRPRELQVHGHESFWYWVCGPIKCQHICPLQWLLTPFAGCVGNRIKQHRHMQEKHGRCAKVLIWPRCRK